MTLWRVRNHSLSQEPWHSVISEQAWILRNNFVTTSNHVYYLQLYRQYNVITQHKSSSLYNRHRSSLHISGSGQSHFPYTHNTYHIRKYWCDLLHSQQIRLQRFMEKHNRLRHVTILKSIKIYLRFEVHDTLTQYSLLGRSAAVWLRQAPMFHRFTASRRFYPSWKQVLFFPLHRRQSQADRNRSINITCYWQLVLKNSPVSIISPCSRPILHSHCIVLAGDTTV